MKTEPNKNLINLAVACPTTRSHLGCDLIVTHYGDVNVVKHVAQGTASEWLVDLMRQYDAEDLTRFESWGDDMCRQIELPGHPVKTLRIENIHQTPNFTQKEKGRKKMNEVTICATDRHGRTLSFRFLFENDVIKRELKAFKEHVLGVVTREVNRWVRTEGAQDIYDFLAKGTSHIQYQLQNEIDLSCISAVEIETVQLIDAKEDSFTNAAS